MDCFQTLCCFTEAGRRPKTAQSKMSKSARSQSFPRSQKPLTVRHEGFFARLKRRLRISSKKSYSVGESLDGIVSTGQYVSRSSMALTEEQGNDPIMYSDMGHNLAHSVEGSNPSRGSIVCVRAESQSAVGNGISPKMFSASQEELVSNAFILPEDNAVDLDDVFIRNGLPSVDGEVPEIMEEPGYETLDNIQKQIKAKKQADAQTENSGIGIKTDFQRGEDGGNIRGQMSKTSLDSGLGSPEQGTQSPNLESEGECQESAPCSNGIAVKVGTQMVHSFHTVHRAPDVNISQVSEDDIYANAQIPMRKKSLKKSQSEPNDVAGDGGDSEAVSQQSDCAPADRDLAMPPPLPERCYSVCVDDTGDSLDPIPQEQPGLIRTMNIPPPLPDRKYSTSDLGMEGSETGNDDRGKLSDSRNKICGQVIAKGAESNVRGSGLSVTPSRACTCQGGRDKSPQCDPGDGGVTGNKSCQSAKTNCHCAPSVKGGLPAESTSSGGSLSEVGAVGNSSLSNISRSLSRGKQRPGSRRSDKTVVEVSFGAVKLREEVDGSGVLAGLKSDCGSSASSGAGNSQQVAVLGGQVGSSVTTDSIKAASQRADKISSCSARGETANAVVVVSGERQHQAVPVESSPFTVPPVSGTSRASKKSVANESGKTTEPDSVCLPLATASDASPSSSVHVLKPRSVAANCVAVTNADLSHDSDVSHSVLTRSVPLPANSPSSISGESQSGGASSTNQPSVVTTNSDTGVNTTDCVLVNATNNSGQNSTSANQVVEPVTNRTNAKSAGPLPRETMGCNSVDTDDLYRDDEPIHMSLQEVFGLDVGNQSPVLTESVPKRRSRMQIGKS